MTDIMNSLSVCENPFNRLLKKIPNKNVFKWRPLQSVEIVQTNQIFSVLTHSLHNNLKNLLFHFREFEYLNQKKNRTDIRHQRADSYKKGYSSGSKIDWIYRRFQEVFMEINHFQKYLIKCMATLTVYLR